MIVLHKYLFKKDFVALDILCLNSLPRPQILFKTHHVNYIRMVNSLEIMHIVLLLPSRLKN